MNYTRLRSLDMCSFPYPSNFFSDVSRWKRTVSNYGKDRIPGKKKREEKKVCDTSFRSLGMFVRFRNSYVDSE